MEIDKDISEKYQVIKFLSITLVTIDHFLSGRVPFIWFPVTLALLFFSYSSGFFTFLKYGKSKFSYAKFWKNKFFRLGISFLVTQIFLFLVFFFQGRSGIFSLGTLLHFLGLSAVFNIFHIQDTSPFGNGLWFLSILLIFYLVFPIIKKLCKDKATIIVACVLYILVTFSLDCVVKLSVALWVTSCGFIIGCMCASFGGGKRYLKLSIVVLMTSVLLRFLYGNGYNYLVILSAFSVCLVILNNIELPLFISNKTKPILNCVFEVYVVHTYLFVHVFDNIVVDFFISYLLIIIVSLVLSKISEKITNACLSFHHG